MPGFLGESWLMSVKIFLLTVSDEFRTYRDALRTDLCVPNVWPAPDLQVDFYDLVSISLQ
jgi:hypothetical protein